MHVQIRHRGRRRSVTRTGGGHLVVGDLLRGRWRVLHHPGKHERVSPETARRYRQEAAEGTFEGYGPWHD